MNWTLSGLWSSVTEAWSAENWPYTLGFWLIVGGVGLLLSRRARRRPRKR
jgi:hypothetical protein